MQTPEIRSLIDFSCDIRAYKPQIPQRWLNTHRKGSFTDLMVRQYRRQMKGRKRLTHDTIHQDLRKNKLKGCPFKLVFQGRNKVVDVFFNDLTSRLMGSPTSGHTMEVQFLALGLNSTPAPASGDTALNSEAVRYGPTSRYTNGTYTFVFSVELGPSVGVLTGNTTVAAGTWTTTDFDVVSAASMATGNRLLVQTSTTGEYTFVTILNKATNSLTTQPLPAAPVLGDTVRRVYGEGGMFMAANVMANHKSIDLDKTADLFIIDGVLVSQPVSQ